MSSAFVPARNACLAHFKAREGYREGPRNNQNYAGLIYGWNFVAWCVQAAWEAGYSTGSSGGVPKTASTGAARGWFKAIGRYFSTPKPGDWSIMLDKHGNTMHTDVVLVYNPSKRQLLCIGGNTSGSYGGSVNEGNGVYINNRWNRWKSGRIHGFGRPLYGVTTEDVKAVQRADGKVKVDGKYGPATKAATKRVQGKLGLAKDGFPGPKTMAALAGEVVDAVEDVVDKVPGKAPAPARLEVDGRFGTSTVKALQEYLNAKHGARLVVDGKAGHSTWRALQKALGTPVDGEVSNQSYKASELGNGITQGWDYDGRGASGSTMVKAMQGWIGVTRDGVWGSATTSALQRKLNGRS